MSYPCFCTRYTWLEAIVRICRSIQVVCSTLCLGSVPCHAGLLAISALAPQGRGPEDVWLPPGGASISAADASAGLILVSHAGLRCVTALTVISQEAASLHLPCAGFSRKRRRRHQWQLHEAACCQLGAEASCLHIADTTPGQAPRQRYGKASLQLS